MRISENMMIRRNQDSHLMKRRRIEYKRGKEEESGFKSQSGHKALIQTERGGVIVPNNQDLDDLSKKSVSIDMLVDCI